MQPRRRADTLSLLVLLVDKHLVTPSSAGAGDRPGGVGAARGGRRGLTSERGMAADSDSAGLVHF